MDKQIIMVLVIGILVGAIGTLIINEVIIKDTHSTESNNSSINNTKINESKNGSTENNSSKKITQETSVKKKPKGRTVDDYLGLFEGDRKAAEDYVRRTDKNGDGIVTNREATGYDNPDPSKFH